jgi:hypothetical protein
MERINAFQLFSRRTVARCFLPICLIIGLLSCGSVDDQAVDAVPVVVSLTGLDEIDTKTGTIGRNYIDMAAPWVEWDGDSSPIHYDSETRELNVPPPGGESDLVLGVQRYDLSMMSRRYELIIDSSSTDVAALIFLFDEMGRMLRIKGSAAGLYVARPGETFRFDAPPGVAGFYVQVQSGWQATDTAALQTRLVDIGAMLGSNLIDPRGPWTIWLGEATEVSFNALIGRVFIQAPEPPDPVRIGVQRFSSPLTPGRHYELALNNGTAVGASVLLYLIDAQGDLVPFSEAEGGNSQQWLSVVNETAVTPAPSTHAVAARQFIAPAGVAEVAVQIQGPWNSGNSAFVIPSLQLVEAFP